MTDPAAGAARASDRLTTHGHDIAVSGVTYSFPGSRQPVLKSVSFDAAAGEAVAIVGRSGCGKSTLLHIIAGLTRPSAGEVRINGEAVRRPSPKRVLMFQQPSLFPWASVARNISLGLRFNGRADEAGRRVSELLALVDMSGYRDRNVQELSGGQQQRVALARSLALSPEILLLDEPFSALDAFTRQALQRDVRRIARDLGLTLVIVTHDVEEAVTMADRVLVMSANPGRIRAEISVGSEGDGTGPRSVDQAKRSVLRAYEGASGLTLRERHEHVGA